MVFVDVCRAVYDYAPQSDEELEIKEGDVLFVLEKSSEDDWWKCKKKAASDDDEEPEGLVPNNYVEHVQPAYQAKALYDYTQQTDEELSFREEARLDVYDDSDPDWTLVGSNGEYGFAPAIYIEKASGAAPAVAPAAPAAPVPLASPPARELAPPPMPSRPVAADEPIPGEADYPDPGRASTPPLEAAGSNPAAALAGIIAQRTGGAPMSPSSDRALASPPLPSRAQYTPEASDEEAPPPIPARPQSQVLPSPPPTQYASPRFAEPPGVQPSPPYNRTVSMYAPAGFTPADDEIDALRSPGGFRMYNVHEMVSHMGKNKKMPTTLGINLGKGLISISPEKSRDGPSQEWTADKLTHYSIEGKHVFVELIRPSKSVDFHAGAKDTAHEIVSQLGELAGMVRAEGFREVLDASKGTGAGGQKKGKMLYEFMAQGDDEVTVAADDEVLIVDDQASEEWWKVQRLKNGKVGVVPSSYVEITGTLPRGSEAVTGLNSARSTVEQNRLEEERLAKAAAKRDDGESIPERGSSLHTDKRSSRRDREARTSSPSGQQPKSKPNASRVRTWTDRSGTFKVEAEFIGLRDNKIHLHKLNGVKIAVPVAKMAVEDLEYVEAVTGKSLDEDKPLSDIKRRSTLRKREEEGSSSRRRDGGGAGAKIERKQEDQYDWFDFFLQCGVNPQICERYASAFSRDQMGPENLEDVNESLLRTLGLKEGDILRVMKHLNDKFGRKQTVGALGPASPQQQQDDSIQPVNGGGLFSGPGGALRNNTRKGRPAPAVTTGDVVDGAAFRQGMESPKGEVPEAKATLPVRQATSGGFDDDAWDVKPAKTQPAAPVVEAPKPVEAPQAAPKLNDDLSLLALPLQPTPTGSTPAPPAPAASAPQAPTVVSPQQTAAPQSQQGADQALFEKIAALAPSRQRPQPAAQHVPATGLAPPPRAASAPGFPPQQQFAGAQPLQAQLTGYQPQMQTGMQYPQPTGFQQQSPQPAGFTQQQPNGGIPAMQQQYPALQPQPTGLAFQPQSQFGQQQAMQQYPAQTGFMQQQQTQPGYQQAIVNGAATGSPFADPPRMPYQPTGAVGPGPSGLQNQYQPTGFQQQQPTFNVSQPTGVMNGGAFGAQPTNGFMQPQAPPPQLPPQQTGGVFGPSQPIQPLVPQKTGPPPPVRFGVTAGANKLMPQPTGRANLAKASKYSPLLSVCCA